MTTLPQPATPTASYTAAYDAWNRLVSLVDGANTVQENAYDGLRRRTIRKDFSSGSLSETRHFYYSAAWQMLEERLNASTNPDHQFVWGLRYIDDCILRDRDTNADGTLDERLYALQDANWNVVALSNTTGDVQERFAYQPYGEPLFLDAAFVPQATSGFDWATLYCGYRYDGRSGLYLVRNRVLHPAVGSWVQRDPIGYADGMSLYTAYFVLGGVDPSGLQGPLDENSVDFVLGNMKDEFNKGQTSKTLPRWHAGFMLMLGRRGIDPRQPNTVTVSLPDWKDWYETGCRGVTGCMLGRNVLSPSSLQNCYATRGQAIAKQSEMTKNGSCKTKKCYNGRPAKPQLIAATWSHPVGVDIPWTIDEEGPMKWNGPPMNAYAGHDFQYYDKKYDIWWGATNGINSGGYPVFVNGSDIGKYNPGQDPRKPPEPNKKGNRYRFRVYCVVCEGDGRGDLFPTQRPSASTP